MCNPAYQCYNRSAEIQTRECNTSERGDLLKVAPFTHQPLTKINANITTSVTCHNKIKEYDNISPGEHHRKTCNIAPSNTLARPLTTAQKTYRIRCGTAACTRKIEVQTNFWSPHVCSFGSSSAQGTPSYLTTPVHTSSRTK